MWMKQLKLAAVFWNPLIQGNKDWNFVLLFIIYYDTVLPVNIGKTLVCKIWGLYYARGQLRTELIFYFFFLSNFRTPSA